MRTNLLLIAFLLASLMGERAAASNFVDHNSKEGLEIIASMLNQQTPIAYQNGLTLIRVNPGDKRLRWLFKLDESAMTQNPQEDIEGWLDLYKKGLINNTCNDKEMVENVISKGTEFVFVIIDSHHERLMQFIIHKETCSKLTK